MASPAQILANRLNSQKSTGPRSAEGKAASSMNALKHGARAESRIIPGEDVQALAELADAYRQEYEPDGPEEELLLDTIVRADWTQRRMARLEAEVFHALLSQSPDSPSSAGAAFLNDACGPNALQKIYRRQQAASREWYHARAELRRHQEDRFLRSARRHPSERTQFAPGSGLRPSPPFAGPQSASPATSDVAAPGLRTQPPSTAAPGSRPSPPFAGPESASPVRSDVPAPGPQPWPPSKRPSSNQPPSGRRPPICGFTGAEPPAWRL